MSVRRAAPTLLLISALVSSHWDYAAGATRRAFTVSDSIEMSRLVEPDSSRALDEPLDVAVAPSGEQAVIIVRQGRLAQARNEYRLVAFDLRNVHKRPQAKVWAAFGTRSELPALQSVRWSPDGTRLAFLARSDEGRGAVYTLNRATSTLQKLTPPGDDVAAFDLLWDRYVVYAVYSLPDWRKQDLQGYAVESHFPTTLATRDPDRGSVATEVRYRVLDLRTRSVMPISPAVDVLFPGPISIEPNGRRAVIAMQVKILPQRWRQFDFIAEGLGDAAANNPAYGSLWWVSQFHLVDLRTGGIRPLLDAPIGTGSAVEVAWSADGRSVRLSCAYSPVPARSPAAIDVEIVTGRVEKHDECAAAPVPAHGRLEFRVRQSPNVSPELTVTDRISGEAHDLTDLNPALRTFAMGREEIFAWADRHEQRHEAGLVLPDNASRGPRPLVIQTHGFSRDEFLVDGPHGWATAFAARALAGQGMVVLQLDEASVAAGSASGNGAQQTENMRVMTLYESAIDALAARGTIDANRVGLIGWSRTGMHVQHAVTFSDHPIAAATVADAVAATPFCQALSYGSYFMHEWEIPGRQIGAPFWGADIPAWLERSYVFHLDRIRAPIRYEALGAHIPCHWDVFAFLKRHDRPVEMLHLRDASHEIQQPWARYASQQGNVDWYSFWLQGREDPDPFKADQYRRWRGLSAQHRAKPTADL